METSDQQDRIDLENMVKQVKIMYENKEYKNSEYGEVCITIAKLLEASNYGREKARSQMILPIKGDVWTHIVCDTTFDGWAIKLLDVAHPIFERYGKVHMDSNGVDEATIRFEPR